MRGRRAAIARRPASEILQDILDPDARLGAQPVTVVTKSGEDGKLIRNLRASDFSVLDDGIPQEVAFFGDEELPLNMHDLWRTWGAPFWPL